MSFWNTQTPNGYEIRCKKAIIDDVYCFNTLSQAYEKLTPGDAPSADLPSWITTEGAVISNSSGMASLKQNRLAISTATGNSATLEPNLLSIGNNTMTTKVQAGDITVRSSPGNLQTQIQPDRVVITGSVLTGDGVTDLNNIRLAQSTVAASDDKILAKDSSGAYKLVPMPTSEEVSIPNYIQPELIAFNNGIDSVTMDQSGVFVGSSSDGVYAAIDAASGTLKIKNGTATAEKTLTAEDVAVANNLKNIARIPTAVTPSKLGPDAYNDVLYNPTTKNFSYRSVEVVTVDDSNLDTALVAMTSTSDFSAPSGIAAYSGGYPKMKKIECKNAVIMKIFAKFNTWYAIALGSSTTQLFKATLLPTNGFCGQLLVARTNGQIIGGSISIPAATFVFKIYNPNNTTATNLWTTVLFERVTENYAGLPTIPLESLE